jgi:hypothetical protein
LIALVGWYDFLPYGWYVHEGGSLTHDVTDGVTKFSYADFITFSELRVYAGIMKIDTFMGTFSWYG